MPQVDTVLCHSSLVHMFQLDMPVVLLQPGVDLMACLSNVILDWSKETRDFPQPEAN